MQPQTMLASSFDVVDTSDRSSDTAETPADTASDHGDIDAPNDLELQSFLRETHEFLYNYICRRVDDRVTTEILFGRVELAIQEHWSIYRPRYGLRAMLLWARNYARSLVITSVGNSRDTPCDKRRLTPEASPEREATVDLFRLLHQPLFCTGDFREPIPD